MSQSSLQLLWDIHRLSPGGTASDDLLWDNDKGEQSYSPLHAVCGGTVGSGPLSANLCGELWLAERMQWCMKCEFTRDEAYLVLLRAFTVRISPGIGMSVSFLSNWMLPTGFYLKLSAPGQTHVHVPHHTNFLCPELAFYYRKLGSSVQLLKISSVNRMFVPLEEYLIFWELPRYQTLCWDFGSH